MPPRARRGGDGGVWGSLLPPPPMAAVIGRFRAKARNSRIGGTPGGIMAPRRATTPARRPSPGILSRPAADGSHGPAGAALGAANHLGTAARTTRGTSAAEPVRPDVLQRALRAAARTHRRGPGGPARYRRLPAHRPGRGARVSARAPRRLGRALVGRAAAA